jgi:hypothetical protein
MSELLILITHRTAHPEFGCETPVIFEYEMHQGALAALQYDRLHGEDKQSNGYSLTTIQIVEKARP